MKIYYKLKDIMWLSVICLVVSLPTIINGIGTTHDSLLHATWVSGFTEQLLTGNLIPRWLSNSFNGLGSSTFYFYPPLTYYLAAIFPPQIVGGVLHTIALTNMFVLFLSGLSFYILIRASSCSKYALLGSIFYIFAPYHFSIDIYSRGAFAESSAFIWYPLIILAMQNLYKGKPIWLLLLPLFISGLILSHTISFLIFLPFYIVYAANISFCKPDKFRTILQFLFHLLLGITIAAYYLVPMVVNLDEIHATFWSGNNNSIVYSLVGGIEKYKSGSIAFALAIDTTWLLLLGLLGLVVFARYKYSSRLGGEFKVLAICMFLGLLLVSYLSYFLWDLFQFTSKIQFSWRLLSVVEFIGIYLLTINIPNIIKAFNNQLIFKCTTVILVTVFVAFSFSIFIRSAIVLPTDKDERNAQINAINIGHGAIEYIPKYSNNISRKKLNELPIKDIASLNSDVLVKVIDKSGNNYNISLSEQGNTTVVVKQFYFPSWHAFDKETGAKLETMPYGNEGLISIFIPTGTNEVELKIEPMHSEIVGRYISLSAILWLAFVFLINKKMCSGKVI